ncbi:MAG: hypothetical protein BWX92_03522 [Deltaproteobacteria bacterium ADurb.Bin135]|nr:MAG: hypothetical protein BWX92_03522 [Deltaproteobacteria bacterium ADurb.Bin135]
MSNISLYVMSDDIPDFVFRIPNILKILFKTFQQGIHKIGQNKVKYVFLGAEIVIHSTFTQFCTYCNILHACFPVPFRAVKSGSCRCNNIHFIVCFEMFFNRIFLFHYK